MDLPDFPALVGTFAFGPVSGVMIELVKNGLQLLSTSTGGVGELANFFTGASYVWAAGFIYRFHKTKKTAWVSCIAGSFIMGIAAAAANYFILLPMFEIFMPLDQVAASFSIYSFYPDEAGCGTVSCSSVQCAERTGNRDFYYDGL